MFVEIAEGDVALKSMLILEDEALVAMMIEAVVRELGVEDVHIFGDVAGARDAARTESIDCAVLDVAVRDGETGEIADILMARGIPVVISTGSTIDALPERHQSLPLINKPFAEDDFKLAVINAVAARRTAPGAVA